jgi:hypothetical protein
MRGRSEDRMRASRREGGAPRGGGLADWHGDRRQRVLKHEQDQEAAGEHFEAQQVCAQASAFGARQEGLAACQAETEAAHQLADMIIGPEPGHDDKAAQGLGGVEHERMLPQIRKVWRERWRFAVMAGESAPFSRGYAIKLNFPLIRHVRLPRWLVDAEERSMPDRKSVDAFTAHVISGDHVGAIRDWYAEDAWMQENVGARRVGREALMAHEAAALARVERVDTELLAPPLIDGDTVVIRWRFTFVPKSGPSMQMEEVAWQTWANGKVKEETFFYDPSQMRPPKTGA